MGLEKESMQVHSVADHKADYVSTLHFLSTKVAESRVAGFPLERFVRGACGGNKSSKVMVSNLEK